MMIRCVYAVVGILLMGRVTYAQTAIPTSQLAWDQPAPTAEEAQGYTYRYYADGGLAGEILAGVTCSIPTGTIVVVCMAPFPAFTPGTHTLTLTASNLAGESAQSTPLTFTFVVTPGIPERVRIQ